MDSIKNIVFDFGGVLIDWNPRYLYREYFNDDRKMEDFLSGICTNEWNSEQDRGRPFDEGVKLLEERFPQYTEAIRMYRDRWGDMLGGEIPGTAALLMRLKGLGYSIYGLTNWSAETFPTAYSRYAVLHEFDGIVVSGQENTAAHRRHSIVDLRTVQAVPLQVPGDVLHIVFHIGGKCTQNHSNCHQSGSPLSTPCHNGI